MKHVTAGIAVLALAVGALGADSPDASEQKVSLQTVPEAGSYSLVVRSDIDQTISMPGMPQPQKRGNTTGLTLRMDISERDAEGRRTMRLRFLRFANTIRQGNRVMMEFDSDDPPEEQNAELARAFGPLLEADLTMTFDAEDKLTDVKGLDDLWEVYAKRLKDHPAAEQIIAGVKKSFGDEALAKMVRPAEDMIPTEPIGVGKRWEVEQEVPVPFIGVMKVSTTNRLAAIENRGGHKVAVIEIQSEFSSDDAEPPADAPAGFKMEQFKGTQNGEVTVESDTGVMRDMSLTQSAEAKASVPNPRGEGTATMTILQTMKQSASMSRVDGAADETDGEE